MTQYTKPWLSLEQQLDRLADRGVELGDREHATALLRAVGYYRLTGYLYPFRRSEPYEGEAGRPRVRVLADYRPGTALEHVESIIDFDRQLRMLVMDGLERVEVAVRMQIGYVVGRRAAFAHLDPATFTEAFVATSVDEDTGEPVASQHEQWLTRVQARRDGSDESFVAHFREKYDDRMPIWALTEVMEMGQLSRLYQGLNQQDAEEIAQAFGVPTKRIMASWLASLNYVRNVAAHHARLFNRKLQYAPKRPKVGQAPPLDHLYGESTAKGVFGTYNALAVIAYLLRSVEARPTWCWRLAEHLQCFPTSQALGLEAMGVPAGWTDLDLWCGAG